jgi:hypothetical protein
MPSAVLTVNFIAPACPFWEAHGKHRSLQSLLLTPSQTDGMSPILAKNKRTVLPVPVVSTNTGCKNLFGDLFASMAVASVDEDASAPIGQPERHQPTYAIRRTRDQYDLAVWIHVSRCVGTAPSKMPPLQRQKLKA